MCLAQCATTKLRQCSSGKKNGRPRPAIQESGPEPLASGYSIPESETGLKLPLTDVGDLHIVPFQPDVFEQGGREMQIADATFQPGDPFLNQGFDAAQQGEFDRHNILQLNVRFSRREDITLRDNRG